MTLTLDAKKFLEIQKRYALTAEQMYKAGELFKRSAIKKLPSGNFQMQSLSRPNQYHQVNPLHESCTCEHAQKQNMCFHLAAWKVTQALTDTERRAYGEQYKNAHAAERHFDDMRNARIITRREQQQRIAQSQRPKVEWVEELDLQ